MKTVSDDGFEIEKDQLVQGSMPIGMPFSRTYEVPTVMAEVPHQNVEKMKFIEIHSRSSRMNDVNERIYTGDQGLDSAPTIEFNGRELEPGKSTAYPLRENPDEPIMWVATAAGQYATVTVGR